MIASVVMQARHGKKKRLEETLNTGFDINAEDAMGNTLLLVAVQQLQVLFIGLEASNNYCCNCVAHVLEADLTTMQYFGSFTAKHLTYVWDTTLLQGTVATLQDATT